VQAADLGAWRGESNHPEWMRFSQAVFAAVRGVDAPMPQIQQTQWQAPPQQQQFVQQSNWPSQNAPAPADNPVALVQHSLRMYVNGKGRARRKELAWFIVLYLIVASVGYFADWQEGFDPVTGQINSYLFRVLVWLIFICPFVSLMSRRSHDIGQSGWVAALAPIPFVGAILALVFAFIPGQPGDNQYGPDPKAVRG
jgi:uncharacterized membrane protein YhaH (DUF805 family)